MSEPRILIVEDESLVAADLEEQLERLGYAVLGQADTGAAAVTAARAARPDLVLMDIQLKGDMDGTAAADLITRELEIPIIFLTAHADEATLERARVTAPFGYLLKPFEPRELRATIKTALFRHKLEQQVRRTERLLTATLRSIGDAVMATDAAGHVTLMNPAAEALTGFQERDSLGRDLASVFLTFDPHTRQVIEAPIVAALKSGQTVKLERDKILVGFGGEQRPIDATGAPIRDEHGRVVGSILVFRDVSERSRQSAAREQLIADLQAALANVRTLQGLLPICAWCKKIRGDRGYWEEVETYVSRHSQAEFTHGICPECLAKQHGPLEPPPP